ncbi:MAG: amidohydrolase family protein [Thermodesulfovibrionia bacterium]
MSLKGFIDIHTHGIGRYDTRTDNPEDILKIAKLHAKVGTTAILPTIHSGTIQQMRTNMEAVREAMEIQGSGVRGQGSGVKKLTTDNRQLATVLGVHLEGPFLNPARCGAQNKKSFIKPTVSSLKKLVSGYEDIIKIITVAPELPGALKVIEKCVSLGIKVNMGHSDATYREALKGKKAGASGISHIFNAMKPFHHREPGLIGLGLMDEDIYIEVIADNIHISKTVLKLLFKIKRPDRIILVSDSVKGAKSRKGPVYLKSGVIAGSAITLSDAVQNIIDIGIPEALALETSIENPKRYLT